MSADLIGLFQLRCKELQTLYLHHNSFTTLPGAMASGSWLLWLLHSLHVLTAQKEGTGANSVYVRVRISFFLNRNLENLQELALEWFRQEDWQMKMLSLFQHPLIILYARYTTPPLPRVIKGSEWQALLPYFLSKDADLLRNSFVCLTAHNIASASSPSSETCAATRRMVE